MQAGELGLFTRFLRSSPHVVALQSLTIWLASFVYLKRVADKVSCFIELDRYHRHLGVLRDLISDYPCPGYAQQRLAIRGYAYFVRRPLRVLKWHAQTTLTGVEELSETCIFSINLVFCLTTALFPGSRVQRLFQRVLSVSPFFLHHLLTLLPLLAPNPNIPSVLARLVPLRPLFLLYFALTEAHCWEVAIAAVVTLSSTLATTGLLLRAGVPLCYRPVPVITHIVLASAAGVGWAAVWDGLLPGTVLLRRLRLARSGTSTVSRLNWRRFYLRSAGGRLVDAFAGSVCPQHIMPAVVLETISWKQWQDAGGNIHSRRMATVDAGVKVESGRIRKCGISRRRPTPISSGFKDNMLAEATASPFCKGSHQNTAGECSNGFWSFGDHLVGMANQPPLRPLPRLLKPPGRRGLEAAAGAEKPREVCVSGLPAQRHCMGQQRWTYESIVAPSTIVCPVGFQPVGSAARRRLVSQLRRKVLRIRIVGTEPEQLPYDWRERVFTHFNSYNDSSRCNAGDPKAEPTYLASGVAVRRGSIFLTLSLVQMPSYHDGCEGAGWGQAGHVRGHGAEGSGVSTSQTLSVGRGTGAQARSYSGPETDGGAARAAIVTSTTQQQRQPAGLPVHGLVRTTSAGTDGRLKHADAPAAHGHSIDGGPAGAHPSAQTDGSHAPAPATSATANETYSPSLGVGQSPPMQSVQRAHGGGGSGLFGVLPSGYTPGRRRIAGVWHAERHGAFHSTSPSSTPGNSNNPLHMLGPAAVSTLSPGSPRPSGILGQGAASLVSSTTMSLAPGLGLAPVGSQQPMRYTSLLSSTHQASMYTGPAQHAAPVGSATLLSYSTEPSPGVAAAVQLQHRGPGGWAGPASSLTHGSVRTGGGTASASMHVAQLLDAMQLRSRDNTSREARHGCVLGVLTAVSQLDSGVPLHLRQVLGTEAWEADDAASSSWEADGVYERPQPPPPLTLQQQQQAQRWAGEHTISAANGFFEISDAPSLPPLATTGPLTGGGLGSLLQQQLGGQQVQTATAPGATVQMVLSAMGNRPLDRASSVVVRPVHEPAASLGYPGVAPSSVHQGGAAWASNTSMWPSHSAGLAVMADRSTLPVSDVAVKPILICKSPLLHAAEAGDLAASIPPWEHAVTAAALPSMAQSDNGPDVDSSTSPASPVDPTSELGLSLMCAPATVPELSVMLRYCGPASVFGEQTYLPVQLQLDSSSPAVAAAIRLQAAASDRDRRGGGDTQAARDVAEAATDPLLAHATVRTALAGLACPGVLYVELWHGPQLCACLPVLLLPESAASWAHEVCSLWQQQAQGEATAAVQGRAGAAAVSAAAHQVVEDLGGWLTYAAHKRYVAKRAAAAATAAAAVASPSSMGLNQAPNSQMAPAAPATGGAAISTVSTGTAATISPPQLLDEWFSGWLVDDPATTALPDILQQSAATAATQIQPQLVPSMAAGMQPGTTVAAHCPPYGSAHDSVGTAGGVGIAGGCNRELFHDMMLQEGYNWLSDCVEAGCCGLAGALMDSLMSAGSSVGEVLRTCRSADGLPLIHAATLSGNAAMMDLVWGWGQASSMDLLGWLPQPQLTSGALPATESASGSEVAAYGANQGFLAGSTSAAAAAAATARMAATGDSRLMPQTINSFAFASKHVEQHGASANAPVSVLPGTGRVGGPQNGSLSGDTDGLDVANMLPSKVLRKVVRYLTGMLPWRVVKVHSSHVGRRVFPHLAAAPSILGALADAMRATTLSLSRKADSACRVCETIRASWLSGRHGACRGAAKLLRNGDAALMALHSLVLRVNVLSAEGGAEEGRFLSHFQQRHGWVFSAWCWSMIPVYALILWRYLLERQWGQLAWTPLWMWMYVVCAAADLAGSTAVYRPRTEALAAAMHLSHTMSKALFCAGLPSYPVPHGRGRLYWMDVLACATLSAICEPVRICVAWPIRLVNFVVSTVLYRFTDTAPTYMEACLLSASCHCFGLLMQHAVESHYRRTFAALQQAAVASSTGVAVTGGVAKSQGETGSADAHLPCNFASHPTAPGAEPPAPPPVTSEQQQQQVQQQNTTVSPSPASPLSLSTSQSRNLMTTPTTGTSTPEMNDWAIGYAAAAAAGEPSTSATAAAVDPVGSASPAVDGSAAQLIDTPVIAAVVEQGESIFRANLESLERPGARLRDRCGDGSGAVRYVLGTGCLNSLSLGPREDFLLADGIWESSEGTSAWALGHTPHSGALMVHTSPAVAPLSLSSRSPQEQLLTSSSPLSLREQWRRQQQQRYSQAQTQAQAAGARGTESQSYGYNCDAAGSEADEQEDGVCMHVSEPLQVQPLSQPGCNSAQTRPTIPSVAVIAAVNAASDSQGASTEPHATTAGVVSSSCGSNTQLAGSTSVSASGACHHVHSRGEVAASIGASDSCAETGRNSENGVNSETGSGAGSGSGIRGSGRGSVRGSTRSLRQLVSRATGWVAGTLRRRSVRVTRSEARKAGHPS